ncbi:Glutamine cyclotransferase [Pelomyxa schiedti]|nr:Glutamine cyclotransferase [Pelomyxa schiedti]
MSWFVAALVLAVVFGVSSETSASTPSVTDYTCKVVSHHPHDGEAFTQGLLHHSGDVVLESTGLEGRSSLRKVDLTTGKVLERSLLNYNLFGEGLAVLGQFAYQLTWRNHQILVWNKDTLEFVKSVPQHHPPEGWGLTTNGTHLIQSDGSNKLYFIDPVSLSVVWALTVQSSRSHVSKLNELEFIKGFIWANVWFSNTILIINPDNGYVVGQVNCTGIIQPQPEVMNGIAYDEVQQRLWVTGKFWPTLFQIEVCPVSHSTSDQTEITPETCFGVPPKIAYAPQSQGAAALITIGAISLVSLLYLLHHR